MTDNMDVASDESGLASRPVTMGGRRFERRSVLLGFSFVCVVALGGFFGYRYLHAQSFEATEDAYVGGNLVQLMPQVQGSVLTIYADDTDLVQAGQPVVKLDPADLDIALEQAEAELAQAVRDVRVMFAMREQLGSEVAVREAELEQARSDVARREGLSARGLVPREELDHAQGAFKGAEAALQAARETLAATKVRIDGTSVQNHPNVARAAARVKDAYLAVQRTTIRAPITGYIAKRAVQVGQRVSPGVPLMAIVPMGDLWVDANFKEVQLRAMRIGQVAKVTADLYGQQIEYAGQVAGLGIGTGAAFALLPAQNASGNWIKVIQRVPVRIRLNPRQLAEHPLRIGLSMRVKVDITASGPQLAQAPRSEPAYSMSAYGDDTPADELIEGIVAANMGTKASGERTSAEAASSLASARTR